MNASVRLALYGTLSGVVLSLLRAPRGLDWVQMGAVDGAAAGAFRLAALAAIALSLTSGRAVFRGPRGVRVGALLGWVAVGYALHGLLLVRWIAAESRVGFALWLVLLTFALRRVSGASAEEDDDAGARPSVVEQIGLVVAGLGATFAIENLAHHVRVFTLALPEDDTVVGLAFLVSVYAGAIAFGPFVARPSLARIAPAVGVALATFASVHGLSFLAGMNHDTLSGYLQRFGMDFSRVGTWKATACLAGASFALTGFVLGTALSAARCAERLRALLFGAAIGVLVARLGPDLAAVPPIAMPEGFGTPWAWRLTLGGSVVAAFGAVVAVAAERGPRRIVASLVALAVPAATFALPVVVWSISPWYIVPIATRLVVPTAVGIVTVEEQPDRRPIVTVDRKRVTPTSDDVDVDDLRIEWSFALLPSDAPAEPSVLVIGQVTPRRSALLRQRTSRLSRTAAWYTSATNARAIEAALFADEGPDAAIPGELLLPPEAKKRLAAGEYDLVLAFPTHGPTLHPRSATFRPWGLNDAPSFASLDVPDGTIGVAWMDAASWVAPRSIDGSVVLAMHLFEDLTVGVVRGDVDPAPSERRPALLPAGAPSARPTPLAVLETSPWRRNFFARRAWIDRIAEAAVGSPYESLARGLAIHFAAQVDSSPIETRAQQIELEEDSLRAWFAALRANPTMDLFSRSLWESLAWLLTEKRLPDMTLAYVEPVADAYAPWPALDRAVGVAYREFLQPEDALRMFERARAADPLDLGLVLDCIDVSLELGRNELAAQYAREGLAIQPGRYDLRRALGIALQADGDPEGAALLRELLNENPEDDELRDRLFGATDDEPSDDPLEGLFDEDDGIGSDGSDADDAGG